MSKKLTYTDAGVDRDLRARAKTALKILEKSYKYSPYGRVLRLPYGNIIPLGDRYLDFVIEGVGTKVLLAQLAEKHDTIGIDGVAMAVNDVIRSGANPLAIADNIHAVSSNPALVNAWITGLLKGAEESGCVIAGGEIGDVAEIMKGIGKDHGFDMVVACIGEVNEANVIFGNTIKAEDTVVGLRSSGLHSNGISLARKVLFKEWGGTFDPYDVPQGLEREIIYEALEPTRIYANYLNEVMKEHDVKGAVHITGDAYLKFEKLMAFSKNTGFRFTNFKPHPIFDLIQKTSEEFGGISDEEMLKTFNMGWGFAIVVDKKEEDSVLDMLEKRKVEAEVIGNVVSEPQIVTLYRGKRIKLR
ncbi:MAG: phosphoribosylformylglycinamidine cyclo-ligase [Candidatus Bathyarchaeota archaeon]|nr:phosphoribosylformylglycinamidine cyclo-ligase [Candidatus Bathyarchaeota archaeon]